MEGGSPCWLLALTNLEVVKMNTITVTEKEKTTEMTVKILHLLQPVPL